MPVPLAGVLPLLSLNARGRGWNEIVRRAINARVITFQALDSKDLYIEFSGNLIPVTKSGVQLKFTFKAFRQNRLSFHAKVKDPLLDPVARMLFMREPKVAKGEPSQQPICILNIVLPELLRKDKFQANLDNESGKFQL